jgi:hypothetical protein
MTAPQKVDIFVSLIAVSAGAEDILAGFVRDAGTTLAGLYTNYEIIVISDPSQQMAMDSVKPLLGEIQCVRYLRLTRAVPRDMAFLAGLDAAVGDFVVAMHPDLDPLSEVRAMIDECRQGNEVVQGRQSLAATGWAYRIARSVFGLLSRWLVVADIPPGYTEFRVLSRSAVNAVTRVRSRRRFFPILADEIGLDLKHYPYQRSSRSGRAEKQNLSIAIRAGMSVLLHYSILPLRIVSIAGLLGSGLSLLYSLYVVLVYLFKSDIQPGWTTMSLQVSGLFALVFLMLSLLGECVGRLLEEGLERPLYHLRDEQSSAVMLANLQQRNVTEKSGSEP